MEPQRYDLVGRDALYQGTRWEPVLTVMSDLGTPTDVSGATARLQIRSDTVDRGGEILIDLGSAPTVGGITVGGTDGTIRPVLSVTQTRGLPAGMARWELDVTLTSGETVTVFGLCEVVGEVSRV